MIAQEFPRPAGTALRRGSAGGHYQMGFGPPVHFGPAGFALRRPALHGNLQAVFDQGTTGAFHGANLGAKGTHGFRTFDGSARMTLIRR